MNKIGVLLAAFSVVGGIAQLWVIESVWVKSIVLGCMLVIAFALFIQQYFRFDVFGAASFNRVLGGNDNLEVKQVAFEAQAREIWQLDHSVFPDSGVNVELGLSWWKKYSYGMYGIWRGDKLLGYISFWPLTKTAFDKFTKGTLPEAKINSRNIVSEPEKLATSYWYIGALVLKPCWCRSKCAQALLEKAFDSWLSSLPKEANLYVSALGASKDLRILLTKLGFHKFLNANDMAGGHAVYVLETQPIRFLDLINHKILNKAA